MTVPRHLKTYTRDDRDNVEPMYEALHDVVMFGEAMTIMERYGLSLSFSDETLEWTCTDPDRVFSVTGTTPSGAVYWWNAKREDVYGRDNQHKIHLVRESSENP